VDERVRPRQRPVLEVRAQHRREQPGADDLRPLGPQVHREGPAEEVRVVDPAADDLRSEEHTSELQSPYDLVCRLLLEKKNYYNVTTGNVTINSYNIHDVALASFRKEIVLLQQPTYLFSGRYSDNLRYRRLDSTDEQVE